MRLELVLGVVLHRVKADQIDLERVGWRIALHHPGPGLERARFRALRPAGDIDGGIGSAGAGTTGQREACHKPSRNWRQSRTVHVTSSG